jgi:ABC-type transport system involved in cytochrome c biogenesis permease subunit
MTPMGETSVMWLRIAAGLYSFGLLDAIWTVISRKDSFFRLAVGAFGLGAMLQLVSIVEQGLAEQRFPANDVFQTLSLCAWLVTAAFLAIFWRYKHDVESLSIFIFPMVFLMTLAASLGSPVGPWSSATARSAWLVAHIVAILIGYAALVFACGAAVLYLLQERRLKAKHLATVNRGLPPLGVLDEMILNSLSIGFAFTTIGVVIATIWAFVERGTSWIGESSVTISFITWGIYLALVFLRVSAGWRGRKAALLSLAALACCAITWVAHTNLLKRLVQ